MFLPISSSWHTVQYSVKVFTRSAPHCEEKARDFVSNEQGLFEAFTSDNISVGENKITLSILSHISILTHPQRQTVIFKMFPALMYLIHLNKKYICISHIKSFKTIHKICKIYSNPCLLAYLCQFKWMLLI